MKKFKLACISTLLLVGVAHANTPCNDFEVKVNNELAEDLNLSGATITGAQINPNSSQILTSKQVQVFRINGSSADVPMSGELIYNTLTIPNKTIIIRFSLNNENLHCHHRDTSPVNEYTVSHHRFPGSIDYSIVNK
ncbi:MAG: hypothetical protein H0U57_13555 [Tatlockia sp.]|nr:hypothetical protein [Tatlockia sp.]